ncbi:MAG TPA: MarR family transcriptional regulator [Acidimicrobiia bacterium]
MDVVPLNEDEDLVWRSLMQLVFTLPRALGEDLQRACGLSTTEYTVLMHLSEATDGQLSMSELARRTNLSPSRITRVIDTMARYDLVERRPGALDGRTTLALLTKTGLAALRRAWPHHLRSVRERAFDNLTPEETRELGPLLQRLAEGGALTRSNDAGRRARPGAGI